jgi:hypothetical protein
MGEYTKQELAPKLGASETFVIGCNDEDLKRVVGYQLVNK